MAISVMRLTGAEERYIVTILKHFASPLAGNQMAALTGSHWKMLTIVKASPAALTTAMVAKIAHRKTLLVFDRKR